MQYLNVAIFIGFMAASFMHTDTKDAFGYFLYVLLGFTALFVSLEVMVIRLHSQMKLIGIQISSVQFSKTDKVSESGHKAKLGQASAMNFKDRLLCIVILKTVLSLIFMCQFCYSFELAQRKFIDEGKIFDADAKLSSSIVISQAMNYSAATLLFQRVVEFILYTYLKKWANDKNNFKLVSEKSSSRKSSRYPKSAISIKADLKLANISCCSVSSDGSTEASHRGE